jgi:ABC-type transport system involved in cytochrome bd biosynthesis fused ATPase/permease subunit
MSTLMVPVEQVFFALVSSTVTLPVLSSSLLLTGLLCIGLVFFIRAASKDRTQTVQFASAQPAAVLRQQLIDYFEHRAYRRQGEIEETDWLTFRGWVRPSVFLALFLVCLAVIGLLCISLVLAFLFPQSGRLPLMVVALAPLAAVFYWRQASREEQIAFKVLPSSPGAVAPDRSLVTLQSHRDEAIQLAARLPLTRLS